MSDEFWKPREIPDDEKMTVDRRMYGMLLDERYHLSRIVKWLLINHGDMFEDVLAARNDDVGVAVIEMLEWLTECKKAVDAVRNAIAEV